MNINYRLVWSLVRRGRVVVGKVMYTKKKTKILHTFAVITFISASCLSGVNAASVTLSSSDKVEWKENGITVGLNTTNLLSDILSNSTTTVSFQTVITNLKSAIAAYSSNPTDNNKAALNDAINTYNAAVITAQGDGVTVGSIPTILFNNYTTLAATTNTSDQRLNVGNNTLSITIADDSTVTISGNTNTNGGALYVESSGLFVQNGGGKLIFNNNAATNSYGGAIYNKGVVTLGSNVIFTKNNAIYSSGAIHNIGTLILGSGSSFTDNTAKNNFGGAISNYGILALGSDSTFNNNNSNNNGGAIYNYGGSLTLGSRATFTNNTSKSGSGGAIYSNTGILTLGTGATFKSNKANSNGGAVYVNIGTFTIESGATFKSNTANSNGGAVYVNIGTLTLGSGATFSENTAKSLGGAIYNNGTLNLITSASSTATQFFGNTDSSGLNSIYFYNGALNISGDGVIDMLDPMRKGGNTNAVAVNQNSGTWYLAGTNNFAASGSNNTTFSITGGELYLYGGGEESKSEATNSDGSIVTATLGIINISGANSSFTLGSAAKLSSGGNGAAITATDGSIILENNATLGFDLSNYDSTSSSSMLTLTANTITVGDNLNINLTSQVSERGDYNLLTVSTDGLLNTDNITLTAAGQVIGGFDFLQGVEASIANNTYVATIGGYTWNSILISSVDGSSLAHGTFTVTSGEYIIDAIFADRNTITTDTNYYGWDGKSLTKLGDGTLVLTGNNTYTGLTTISSGTLKTGVEDTFANTSGVTVASGATLNLGGNSQTVTSLNNSGILLFNDYNADVIATIVTLYGDVTNSGTVIINNGSSNAGQTLKVDGNWIGESGTVSIGTVLGDDSSLTDKLVITGSATGTTYVVISNENGAGAQTIEGIEVITTGSSTSEAFSLAKRVVAGSYEYSLKQGTNSSTNLSNWYLTSKYIDDTDTKTDTYVIRPEAGSYIANLASANTLFNTILHDRLGETQYTDWLTGEKLVTSMWIRSVVGQNKFEAGHSQLKNRANWSLVQLGGDIAQWTSNQLNRLHLGVMAGYGRSSSDTDSKLSGYRSKGKIDGYSLGLYGTWYDNDADKTGFYLDSWVLWNHFNAQIHGQELDKEKYKLKGLTASIESGYTFKLSETENYSYWLQPKAQVIYMGVDADSHTETNGTKVKGNANNWQSRLGLRFSASMGNLLTPKPNSTGQFFIEANWLHNTETFTIKMNRATVSQDGARNIAEIKTGIETDIQTNANVWFNVGYQRSNHHYSNLNAMLGIKYSF